MTFKLTIAIILFFLSITSFSQNDDDEELIQNFYYSCKSDSYGAFNNVNKGIQLFDTKQYNRSINNFSKALQKDNNYCDPYYLIGYCHQKMGNYEKALKYCDSTLLINPKSASAIIVKANTLYLLSDTSGAAELFEQVIDLIPDKIDGYYGQALMLHKLGQHNKAKDILTQLDTKNIKTPNIREKRKIKELKARLNKK